jgi:hypothetical protein
MTPKLSFTAGCTLVAFAAACGASPPADAVAPGAAATASQAADNAREALDLPALPSGELIGQDDNADHIRDDIESYIDETYAGRELQRLSARQAARALMHHLVVDVDHAALDAADEQLAAYECMAAAGLDESRVMAELLARTADSDARLRAYFASNGRMSGAMLRLPERGLHNCTFDTAGLEP